MCCECCQPHVSALAQVVLLGNYNGHGLGDAWQTVIKERVVRQDDGSAVAAAAAGGVMAAATAAPGPGGGGGGATTPEPQAEVQMLVRVTPGHEYIKVGSVGVGA